MRWDHTEDERDTPMPTIIFQTPEQLSRFLAQENPKDNWVKKLRTLIARDAIPPGVSSLHVLHDHWCTRQRTNGRKRCNGDPWLRWMWQLPPGTQN